MNILVDKLNVDSNEFKLLQSLGDIFIEDLSLQYRKSCCNDISGKIKETIKILNLFINQQAVVYTAFDGDHFHCLQQMRQFVLSKGKVPANPESILGYKNVVDRRQTKMGVLIEDVSILKKCKELWIFSDVKNSIEGLGSLAEGVLVELAYFLYRRPMSDIKLVSISKLMKGEEQVICDIQVSFDDLKSELIKSNRENIITIANSGHEFDNELKPLRFFITDPLDFKYYDWIRCNKDGKCIPLVPGTVIETSDFIQNRENIGKIVVCWAILMKTLTECCTYIPSMEKHNTESVIQQAFIRFWKTINDPKNIEAPRKGWEDLNVLKSIQKDRWPVTQFEAGKLL
jgi:hypothetical protein